MVVADRDLVAPDHVAIEKISGKLASRPRLDQLLASFSAGSLSLVVSLPTMLVAFARYSRDGSFAVLGENLRFVAVMVVGSITGALLGGLLLGVIPDLVLIPILAIVLLISAVKMARHT